MMMRWLAVVLVLCGGVWTASAASNEDDLYALALSASHNIAAGRYDDGLKALDRAMKTYPKSPNLDLIYGLSCKAYVGRKGFAQAIAFCSAAILRNPNNANYYVDRAISYYWSGDRIDARKDLDAATALGPNRAAAYGLKARLFWEEGNLGEARTACWMATKLDAKEPNAHFVLAAILNRKKPPKIETPSVAPSPRAVLAAAPLREEADIVPKPKPPAPSVSLVLDCRSTSQVVERQICRDAGLRYRETALRRLYEQAFAAAASPDAMEAAQRDWIAVRDACATRACLVDAYSARTSVLKLWMAD